MSENIHHAGHLKTSALVGNLNLSAIRMVGKIYQSGAETGVFRPGLDQLDIHLTLMALAFYKVSNRATINVVFGRDMGVPEVRARRRASIIEAVLRFVRA
ncbi:MAG: hypothetical protein CFE31_15005 [Rhizobiales bacterium PAR1]|nr:MAG: hypothetical protein CFE31_15005 [Rhizobiales bacterium PAR1]